MNRAVRIPDRVSPYFQLSGPFLIGIIVLSLLSLLTPNPTLTVFAILCLPIFAKLLWIRGEPPVLFFVVTFQWLEVTTKVFHANFLGISVEEMFGGEEIKVAIILGMIGLFAVATGMRIGLLGKRNFQAFKMESDVRQYSINRLWRAYWIAWGASVVLQQVAKRTGPLWNYLMTLSYFKWAIFFILAYTIVKRNEKRQYLIIATAFEVIMGFSGFFSTFKYVFYLLIIVFLACGYRLTLKNSARNAFVIGFCFLLSCVWMSIRPEYRTFMAAGRITQEVGVPFKARMAKLYKLVTKVDLDALKNGAELVLFRLAYVDMFAQVLRTVPERIPYEGGALWRRAIEHITTPRLFFPDKPRLLSDSEATMKYTGLYLAGEESATSISMGYMVESYIDFGPYGMFAPVFLLGLLWGLIYRYFVSSTRIKVFGYGIATIVLIDSLNFSSSGVKLFGGVLTSFIVMFFVSKLFVPRINRWFFVRHA